MLIFLALSICFCLHQLGSDLDIEACMTSLRSQRERDKKMRFANWFWLRYSIFYFVLFNPTREKNYFLTMSMTQACHLEINIRFIIAYYAIRKQECRKTKHTAGVSRLILAYLISVISIQYHKKIGK